MSAESRERRLLRGRLCSYRGKTLDQMTDDECRECLRLIYEQTGTLYYER